MMLLRNVTPRYSGGNSILSDRRMFSLTMISLAVMVIKGGIVGVSDGVGVGVVDGSTYISLSQSMVARATRALTGSGVRVGVRTGEGVRVGEGVLDSDLSPVGVGEIGRA